MTIMTIVEPLMNAELNVKMRMNQSHMPLAFTIFTYMSKIQKGIFPCFHSSKFHTYHLVGGLNSREKYQSIGILFPGYGKIKNVPNYQPVIHGTNGNGFTG